MACCFVNCNATIVEELPSMSIWVPVHLRYGSKDGCLLYCMDHYMSAVRQYTRFKGHEGKVCLYMLLQIDGHIFNYLSV